VAGEIAADVISSGYQADDQQEQKADDAETSAAKAAAPS
jgi:hypothetical protein